MTRTPEEIQVDIDAAINDVDADGYYARIAELYGELKESALAHEQPLWAVHAATWARNFFADRARRDSELESQRGTS